MTDFRPLVEDRQQPGQYGSKLRALFPGPAVFRNPSQALMVFPHPQPSLDPMACSY